jgi:hypothetical protein
MLYISLREVLIRNKRGTHDQIIPANTPTFVAPPLHEAAYAAGCAPCDAAGKVVQPGQDTQEDEDPEVANYAHRVLHPEEDVPAYTTDDVKEAVEALIARNNKADFGVTGRPKVGAVAKLLGHKPSADELDQAWNLVVG